VCLQHGVTWQHDATALRKCVTLTSLSFSFTEDVTTIWVQELTDTTSLICQIIMHPLRLDKGSHFISTNWNTEWYWL
jgi:hypothetical protein